MGGKDLVIFIRLSVRHSLVAWFVACQSLTITYHRVEMRDIVVCLIRNLQLCIMPRDNTSIVLRRAKRISTHPKQVRQVVCHGFLFKTVEQSLVKKNHGQILSRAMVVKGAGAGLGLLLIGLAGSSKPHSHKITIL